MSKTLIVLMVGMLVVGCASTPTMKSVAGTYEHKDDDDGKLVLLDNGVPPVVFVWPTMKSVAGTYELKKGGVRVGAYKRVFLDNGVIEYWQYGKKTDKDKWKIIDGDIHARAGSGGTGVLIINKDGSITQIAVIPLGRKRRDIPKEDQLTFKKIK